ncbi:hypothetical protein BD626DRAFT_533693 [Schizophyllum amplum]|uniref:Uncharacterized protein n=1 Tax=Schizophyllum amplum TaxID=97359 RepID=A0A550D060_9AGAR|nr:hypothetical protein BD626DRAFT_533693 [Auriculariopsis ampla]
MQWAEDEYGVAVDGYVASDMRNQASAIWASLDLYGYAPRSWAQMCNEARDFYVWRMVKTFPILGLCDSDWKALQIGKDNYHGWQKNHRVGGASELPSESTDNDEEKQQKNQKQADKRKGKERAPGHAQPTTEPDAQPPKRPLAAVERDREDEPPAKKLHVPPDASESETGSRYITLKDPLARPRRKPKNMHVRLADDARPIGASIVPQGVVLDGARSSDNPSHDDQGVDAPQQLEPDVPPSEQSTSIAPANRASASHCADATPTQPGRHSPVSPAADLPPRPVPGTPAPVTPFVPNAKKYKRPGKINGPKTLAGVEWADKNPDGTTAEFDEFYNRLTKDQLKRQDTGEAGDPDATTETR